MSPARMTAIAVRGGKGAADALYPVETDTPRPAAGEVLIRVSAAGVNRPDVAQRQGSYPPPPGAPQTLGLEVAGEIVELGDGVEQWAIGDAVVALLGGGGYAQYAVVDARHALPVPPGLTRIEAASLPETIFTVFANVFEHGGLQAGETLLVHGATSGIGVAAIQMAKAAGARVIATARGGDKAHAALAIGADVAVDATSQDFAAVVEEDGGADVILDMVGGPYFAADLDALKPRGRIVYISTLGGATIEVPVRVVMQKQAVITGSTLRPRTAAEKARIAAAVQATVWPWIADGRVKAVVDRTFPLAEAAKAHAYLERGGHVGKVILTV